MKRVESAASIQLAPRTLHPWFLRLTIAACSVATVVVLLSIFLQLNLLLGLLQSFGRSARVPNERCEAARGLPGYACEGIASLRTSLSRRCEPTGSIPCGA